MVQLIVLGVIFAAFVYTGARWQKQRNRNQAVVAALQTQVGKRGIVTEAINQDGGLVRLNGDGFAACTTDGSQIPPRVLVSVEGIHRYRLVVSRIEGQGQLIDVDELTDQDFS